MDRAQAVAQVAAGKQAKGRSYADLAEEVGCGPIFLASVVNGQASMPSEAAERLVAALGLEGDVATQLQTPPLKEGLGERVPIDPLIYRLYEIVQIYGVPLKEVIQEEFGDGIMSAIDFELHMERKADPRGDRVVLTMDGKFLPYRSW